jgi:hypothetical protein
MVLHEAAQAVNQIDFKTPHSAWYVFFWALGLLLVVLIVLCAATIANQAEDRREARAHHRRGVSHDSPDH